MRFASFKPIVFAVSAVLVSVASAQYNQGMQPYNAQDPQNYGAPAAQGYYNSQGQAQGGYSYAQQPQGQYQQGQYPQQPYQGQQNPGYQQPYDSAASSQGQEQVYQAPPELQDYDQPQAPGDGYIWTPGCWAWARGRYLWVPGAWVLPPYQDALWTPGYWGYGGAGYFWNAGYWGPTVGFYGGINYGFGYFGTGFYGGYWRDHHFWYNNAYAHVGFGFHNVYNQRYGGFDHIRPSGQSFTTAVAARGGDFRGGSFNGAGRGFAAQPARGFTSPGLQPGLQPLGRPASPGSTYNNAGRSGYSAPSYTAPAQRSFQSAPQQASRSQSFSGGYGGGHAAAPAQHFSAPSGGGGFHGGGGGSSHGGHR